MKRPVAILLFVLCAHSASAASGTGYTVRIVRSGDAEETRTFEVIASGDRLRASHLDAPPGEGIAYDVLLRDRATVTALNTRNRTWYALPGASPFALDSSHLSPVFDKKKAKNVRARLDPPRVEQGERHYGGVISYEVEIQYEEQRVKVWCVASFRVSTTDAVDRGLWLGDILPRTGFPEVDAEMKAAEAAIEGFPVRLSLNAKRTYEGGEPMVETVRVEVSEIGETAVDATQFVRPADYRNQKPVIAVPGL